MSSESCQESRRSRGVCCVAALAAELLEVVKAAGPGAAGQLQAVHTSKAWFLRQVVAACDKAGEKLVIFTEL